MLNAETPFPYVGSYCLIEHEGRDQLARILGKRGGDQRAFYLISFPLRPDAGGNRVVDESELTDGTPLTAEEEREYHDLDRLIFNRSASWARRHKAEVARRDALRRRMIVAPLLSRLLRSLRDRELGRAA